MRRLGSGLTHPGDEAFAGLNRPGPASPGSCAGATGWRHPSSSAIPVLGASILKTHAPPTTDNGGGPQGAPKLASYLLIILIEPKRDLLRLTGLLSSAALRVRDDGSADPAEQR
jgi:hypothetical protein